MALPTNLHAVYEIWFVSQWADGNCVLRAVRVSTVLLPLGLDPRPQDATPSNPYFFVPTSEELVWIRPNTLTWDPKEKKYRMGG